jgi:hypothetical protein
MSDQNDQQANEIALEYGMKLVERMADQREDLRKALTRVEAERDVVGNILTAMAYAAEDGRLKLPEPAPDGTAVHIVEEGDESYLEVIEDEEGPAQG